MQDKKHIFIDDVMFAMNFPSCARVNQLQKVLDVQIFRDVRKLDEDPTWFTHALDTDAKQLEALKIMLEDGATAELAGSLTAFDVANLCTVFFSGMLKLKVRLNGESVPSADSSKVPVVANLQEGMNLTLASSSPEKVS